MSTQKICCVVIKLGERKDFTGSTACSGVDFVVKYGGQGQSGQTIKLFQITPYVNDFQRLNNPRS